MRRGEVVIVNRLGLHARPSAALTQAASRFQSEVWLSRGPRRVNGKSIMGVMMLAAEEGSTIRVRTIGRDAEQALAALRGLVDGKFGGEP